ncbi:hypothetical protein L1787_13765 [Acuticoccus sp. M5D2P5]|uniref:hypothetical protein n=1 Tax=Acuticoccus kalidii TaxID=2910977 RepID=UPI001F1A3016|nr:hypothetical protein [Acuticoccus kalidii]MCF3934471.1 hypothetical protein [Acuticoccus kalidii]
MSTLFKLIALAIVVVLLSPVFAGNTQFGQVVGAAIDDARSFCDRRPETCRQGMELMRVTGRLVGETLTNLADNVHNAATSGNDDALTPEDRALSPASVNTRMPDASAAAKGDVKPDAFAAHGQDRPI